MNETTDQFAKASAIELATTARQLAAFLTSPLQADRLIPYSTTAAHVLDFLANVDGLSAQLREWIDPEGVTWS